MINKKVYLASPFFNDMERGVMQATLSALRTQYAEVYAPFEHTIPNAWDMSNKEWGKAVFQADIEAIKQADIVYVIVVSVIIILKAIERLSPERYSSLVWPLL